MRIVFAGGGTGGHFYPILALIREVKHIAEEERIVDMQLFLMSPSISDESVLRDEGVVPIRVMSGKWRRYWSLLNVVDLARLAAGSISALWNMYLIMPDVVFSKGGYGALPAVIAAIILRIPLVIHESDAVPGKVNLFAARFARRIGIAFKNAAPFFPKEKTALVGVPIRKWIFGGEEREARERLDVFSDLPVVGFIGGSQGAQKLNAAILGVLKELTDEFEVLHQTGPVQFADVRQEASVIVEFAHKERYHPFGFLDPDSLRDFYRTSRVIISRAGGSAIYEIAAWGKPSILVPLAHAAQDHQRQNAYEYAAVGAAHVLEEENLTPHLLYAEIKKVLNDEASLEKMGTAAKQFARIDAAELIAREILKIGLH